VFSYFIQWSQQARVLLRYDTIGSAVPPKFKRDDGLVMSDFTML